MEARLGKYGGIEECARADVFLVRHGYASSRAEAQAAIAAGKVAAEGKKILKAAQILHAGMNIAYEPAHPFVSRGGVKLTAALDAFGLSPEGCVCLDVGSSTGGFTEVLLMRGAARVYAVDVGREQLHERIKSDPRTISLEGLDARDISPTIILERPNVITADVSFISLKLALPAALALAAHGAWAVLLVKPQFEVGRTKVPRTGVVKDEALRERALDEIAAWVCTCGWNVIGTIKSPILGGDGNREFLLAARKD